MAVYSLLKGRLGNILFQIATGLSLAKERNEPFYAVYHYSGKNYVSQYQNTLLSKIHFVENLPKDYHLYEEKSFSYQKIEIPKGVNDVVLDGFFQSELYFDEKVVRDMISLDGEWTQDILNKYKDILELQPISINVRRGDYLQHPKQHPVCSLRYFKNAIKRFSQDTVFLVSSDDIPWCRKHFKGSRFFFAENNSVLDDLLVQSKCEGNIIANGTFSWWGAWLNDNPQKRVLFPDPWFGSSYRNLDTSTLIPSSWEVVKRKIPLTIFFSKSYIRIILRNVFKKLGR